MRPLHFFLAAPLLAVALATLPACAPRSTQPAAVPPSGFSAQDLAAATLGPGDVFEVRVFQEPELSGVFQVGPQGDIIFPLCKRVVVMGLDPNGAAEKLRSCLGEGFMRNPQVSVLVKEYNSKKVFVFGEVQKPGTFPFEEKMSIVQAITVAGGFTRNAAQNSTSITRRVNGQEVKTKINVQDIALGKQPNVTLEPGDIIFVPESMF
jgi:polysaccharide export outer membrane protein